jgi:ssRNA-specific RNase YbeY (16S rRNA maturation enzyme)
MDLADLVMTKQADDAQEAARVRLTDAMQVYKLVCRVLTQQESDLAIIMSLTVADEQMIRRFVAEQADADYALSDVMALLETIADGIRAAHQL